MFFDQREVEKIITIALEAGEIAKKYFIAKNFEISPKADGSRVTSADLEISDLIQKKLITEFPRIPAVCEENNMTEIASDIFWLIDPIDGTNSFIDNSVEFATNIALVKNKKAIFGLIYVPLFEEGKMVFLNHDNKVILRDNKGSKMVLKSRESSKEFFKIIVSPRSKEGDIKSFVKEFSGLQFNKNNKKIEIIRLSSAVKFIKLLSGEVDFYLHLRKSMEWDTAAGQALIEAMGGYVKDLFFNEEKSLIGENMTYKKPNFSNPTFIAKIYG